MSTRKFSLTDAEANHLQAAYLHCDEADTKIRYQATRLYGIGYNVEQILDICGCSRRSLVNWTRAYSERGVTSLVDHRLGGNHARLTPEQSEAVQNQLHQYSPAQLLGRDACVGNGQFWTLPDLARLLQRDYEVTYQSRTSYRTLLEKCDFSYQRPAKQYKSHSEVKLMEFEEDLEKK